MSRAEKIVRESLANKSPGKGASELFQAYTLLSSESEREAFVSVLVTRVAVSCGHFY
jgi:hypothetical protein